MKLALAMKAKDKKCQICREYAHLLNSYVT